MVQVLQNDSIITMNLCEGASSQESEIEIVFLSKQKKRNK